MAVTQKLEIILELKDLLTRPLKPGQKAIEDTDKSVKKTSKSFSGLEGSIKKALGALVGIGAAYLSFQALERAAAGVANQVRSAALELDDLAKTSAKTAISVEDLSRLNFAAQLSGVNSSETRQGFRDLLRNVSLGKEAFNELGLSAETLKNQLPIDIFLQTAQALGKVENATDRARIAQDIFGETGTQLLPLLTGDVAALVAEADRLGGVMSTQTAKAAEQFNDSLSRLGLAFRGLRASLLEDFFPRAADGFNALANLVADNRDVILANIRSLLPSFGEFINAIAGIAEGLIRVGAVALDAFDVLRRAGLIVKGAFIGLQGVVMELVNAVASGIPELGNYIVNAFERAVFEIGRVFDRLKLVWVDAKGAIQQFAADGLSILLDFASNTARILEKIPGYGTDAAQAIRATGEEIYQATRQLGRGLAEQRNQIEAELRGGFGGGSSPFASGGDVFDLGGIRAQARELNAALANLDSIGGAQANAEGALAKIRALADSIKTAFSEAGSSARMAAADINASIGVGETTEGESTGAQSTGLLAGLTQGFKQFQQTAIDVTNNVAQAIQGGLSSAVQGLTGAFNGFFDNMITKAKSTKEAFGDMIQGILMMIPRLITQMLAAIAVAALLNVLLGGAPAALGGGLGALGGGSALGSLGALASSPAPAAIPTLPQAPAQNTGGVTVNINAVDAQSFAGMMATPEGRRVIEGVATSATLSDRYRSQRRGRA